MSTPLPVVGWIREWSFNGDAKGSEITDDEALCRRAVDSSGGVMEPLCKVSDALAIMRLWLEHHADSDARPATALIITLPAEPAEVTGSQTLNASCGQGLAGTVGRNL